LVSEAFVAGTTEEKERKGLLLIASVRGVNECDLDTGAPS
jgi:hypothetical protein